jgi:hypothetical protein
MRRNFLYLSVLLVVTLACGLPVAVTTPTEMPASLSTNIPLPASETPAPEIGSSTDTPGPVFEGNAVSFGPLNLVLPPGLASGINGNQFPRAEGENIAPWEVTPGHTQVELEGYILQGKFHKPQILIYPAQEYAEMVPAVFESIHRLNNLLYDPNTPISNDNLPTVPFFNAAPIFASNIEVIPFQNGQGVRFLTEYAQYTAPVNNHELFYHFQGVTNDGADYVIAILPITALVLPETSDPESSLPTGGIEFPDLNDPNVDWDSYYKAVAHNLDLLPANAFTPTINQLDALIQSMQTTP